ncbi:MAG: DNA-processing protein DprA [Oscillospiraceae bacterium]|nr:DNA-processing protein DprA [Oscillospiraceae bacterium]
MSMLRYWVWLSALRGIKTGDKLRLAEELGGPEAVFFAREEQLRSVGWLSDGAVEALSRKELSGAAKAVDDSYALGHRILTIQDALYPLRLKNIYDPPLVLYIWGRLPSVDDEVAVAVVGTRKCTPYGRNAAQRTAWQISKGGGLIVSGLATGIDTAAALGALRADGRVIGVSGRGLDAAYPRENLSLYEDCAATGAVISEYPPGTNPERWRFPERNRIMAGLSLGVLVVEAPQKSGALITARLAAEEGRDVFVIPGNVDSRACEGSNELIREGATMILSGEDILEEYRARYPHRLNTEGGSAPVPDYVLRPRPEDQTPKTDAHSDERESAAEQTDEEKKKDLITNEIPKLGEHPSEEIVRILFRIIKKPTINEATSGVYDAAVSYLKSIQRY